MTEGMNKCKPESCFWTFLSWFMDSVGGEPPVLPSTTRDQGGTGRDAVAGCNAMAGRAAGAHLESNNRERSGGKR